WSFLCAVRHEMATDQVRIESLYARLYRTIIGFGLLIAAAWLFAAFSYYLSRKTGSDWFSRSGSMMALVGTAVTFRLVNFYQRGRVAALKEGLVSIPREIELGLEPPKSYQVLSYFGYFRSEADIDEPRLQKADLRVHALARTGSRTVNAARPLRAASARRDDG